MKVYKTGLIGVLACSVSLMANVHISQGFNVEYPTIFWGSQILMGILILVMLIRTLKNWDNTQDIPKTILLRSMCAWVSMYCIAYIESKYSFVLILIVGVVDVYFTRKRFGLVKKVIAIHDIKKKVL